MIVNFELIAQPNCGIAVDSSSSEYDTTDFGTLGNLSKQTSVVVNIICKGGRLISSGVNDDNSLYDYGIIDTPDETEVTYHNFQEDGIYEVHHFVIPNEDWYWYTDYFADWGVDTLIYYSPTEKKFIKAIGYDKDDEYSRLKIDDWQSELLKSEIGSPTTHHTVYRTLSTCRLHECYYQLAKELLINAGPCNPKDKADLIYKRDMAWMGINVIDYLLEQGNLEEADTILQNLEGCNGICPHKLTNKRFGGCGCTH